MKLLEAVLNDGIRRNIMSKNILITGIGGLTPRSIATIIRENHPDYKLIGCDIDNKAMGYFMKGLVNEYYVCPKCNTPEYFPWINKLVEELKIDYAFVQPEAEIVEWGNYFEKNGKYPCPVFMGSKLLSESLRDKSIMADLLEGKVNNGAVIYNIDENKDCDIILYMNYFGMKGSDVSSKISAMKNKGVTVIEAENNPFILHCIHSGCNYVAGSG